MPLEINGDNYFQWKAAKNARTGDYINSGAGTWELKTREEELVASGTMTATGSGGNWYFVIDRTYTTGLTPGSPYLIDMTLTDGAGAEGASRLEEVAQYTGARR